MVNRREIIDWAELLYDDLDHGVVREWLAAHPGRKAAGYLPVYAPRELIHASGMLPVGIHGGGDKLEIIKGDAFYQSYICHLPRSVIELAQSGRLDMLSAVLFPATCDVIRNLSGMWKLLHPNMYVRYVDVPQVQDPALATEFWRKDLELLLKDLGDVSETPADAARLSASIELYNEVRRTVRALYRARSEQPWRVPSAELYVLLRAGELVPPEVFLEKARAYLSAVEASEDRIKDKTRVIVVGSFCEQPPLGLIKTLERAGCYIVDDDFLLGNRFLTEEVPVSADPLLALARTFIEHSERTSVIYERDPVGKQKLMKERVKAARADGIIFAAASFCDPALLDRPMLKSGADQSGIPSIAFQYSENTGQFQQFREQAGTFADSIKLWADQNSGANDHDEPHRNAQRPVHAAAKGHDRRSLPTFGGGS